MSLRSSILAATAINGYSVAFTLLRISIKYQLFRCFFPLPDSLSENSTTQFKRRTAYAFNQIALATQIIKQVLTLKNLSIESIIKLAINSSAELDFFSESLVIKSI
jgi:hypothetical protein